MSQSYANINLEKNKDVFVYRPFRRLQYDGLVAFSFRYRALSQALWSAGLLPIFPVFSMASAGLYSLAYPANTKYPITKQPKTIRYQPKALKSLFLI